MSESRTIAIVNPVSADGSTERVWPELAQQLAAAGFEVEARFTQHSGHGAQLTRQALREGARRILSVGGDGTLNEVINGFFEGTEPLAPEAAIGIVCRGTGCDFIRSLGIPQESGAAIAFLQGAQPRPIDVGRVRFVNHQGLEEIRYFVNVAEAGLGGAVVERVNGASKALGGRLTFLAATLGSIAAHHNQPAEVVVDGSYSRHLPLCNLVVANGRYFGGGMQIMPDADLADGQLDVLVMGDFGRLELISNLARVYRGTHLGHAKVERFAARSVRVTSAQRLPLDLDGESPGTTPAEFDVVPSGVLLLH